MSQIVKVGIVFLLGVFAILSLIVAGGGHNDLQYWGGLGFFVLCVLLARFLEKHHAHALQQHLDKGGLLLWVHTLDEEHERKALDILHRAGAEDAHVHSLPKPDYGATGGVSKQLSFISKMGL